MYRFALRPAWLISHVLVLGLIIALANLGLWQLRRLDERQDRNALVEARSNEEPVPIEDLLSADVADVQFRRVEVTGTFVRAASVLVDNRTLDGQAGAWVLDAVELSSGETVIVNRGFVPFVDGIDVPYPLQPDGEVTFEAVLAADAGRSCASAPIDDADIAARYSCEDLDVIAADLGVTIRQSVDIRAIQPLTGSDVDRPSPVPLPDLGNGPHFGYAVQWFIFTTIAIVGYPLVLRRVARQKDVPDVVSETLLH